MSETRTDYQLLSIFGAVAQQTSFTKAARQLGIAKGTVSRAIAELERQLGTELLHRTTHAVALSTAGLALYERIAPHLSALDQAVLKLPERAAQPSGELRMTAPNDFGLIALPEILVQFARRYPEVRVDVRLTNLQIDLVAEGFDLAIRAGSGQLKSSTLTARRLGASGIGFYAAPSYLARRGKPKELGEAGHDWIVHPAARAALKLPRHCVPRFLCDDFLLIRDLARDGAGVAALPPFFVTAYVRDGLLEEVPIGEKLGLRGTLFLVYPSSGQVPRKVTAFRDFVLEWKRTSPLE